MANGLKSYIAWRGKDCSVVVSSKRICKCVEGSEQQRMDNLECSVLYMSLYPSSILEV